MLETGDFPRRRVAAQRFGGAGWAGDTIKRARDSLVEATLERSELFAVQTPQVFQVDLIKAALVKALEDGAALTDDHGAVERLASAYP